MGAAAEMTRRHKTPLERIADSLIGLGVSAVIVVILPALAVFVWLDGQLPPLARWGLIFGIVLAMLILTALLLLFGQMLIDDHRRS